MTDDTLKILIKSYLVLIRILWVITWIGAVASFILFILPPGTPAAIPAVARITSAEKLQWMMISIYCFLFGLAMMVMNWFIYWVSSPPDRRPKINTFPFQEPIQPTSKAIAERSASSLDP